jgi:hypothetical protein
LRAGEAVFAPLDFGRRTGPCLLLEDRPVSLRELAVEAAVVRDDDRRVVDERGHHCFVDAMSRDHLGGDAGERGDLGWHRFGRFVEGGERVSDAGDATVWQVIELDHPQFDDLVPSRIEAGRLGIE